MARYAYGYIGYASWPASMVSGRRHTLRLILLPTAAVHDFAMAETTSQRPFKVIIAGGSVAGLTLANALEKADIEWVLLEKRDVVPSVGQTIFVMPCTTLVFEQLGIHKLLEEIGIPMKTREHFDKNMKLFCSSDELWQLSKKKV